MTYISGRPLNQMLRVRFNRVVFKAVRVSAGEIYRIPRLGTVQVWARFARSGMSREGAERPGWGRWEQLAWSDLAPAEQAIEASGESEGRVVASSVIEAAAGDSLWLPWRNRSPPGFDEASIDGLRQSISRSPSCPGTVVSASRRDERRDERRRSAGDDVVSALVSMQHRA